MIRKCLLLVAVTLGCLASPAYGLGLGELELNSALNQQFSAEIRLTNVRGLQVEEILPNLASQEDFDRVGVERNYLLTDLRFKVVSSDRGEMVIQVTSSRPIIEPFLNFIVEVLWPTGRILREYTVLLDPPVFGQQGIEAVQPSQTSSQSSSQSTNQSRPPAPRPIPAAPAPRQRVAPAQPAATTQISRDRQGNVSGDEYGMTGQGDTLWTIALRVRPNDSVSVQQTMLALQRANPEAFINNNINLLKAGYVLRIPDAREIRQESIASAVQEVRVQNQEFDDYKDGSLAQLDATRRQTSSNRTSDSRADGELKLLASDDNAGDRSGAGGSARVQGLENELAVAEEDLDRARRANSELNVKVEDLQGQLDTLNEILTLKDDQLAALKAEVIKMQAASSQTAPAQPAPAPSGSLFSNPLVLGGIGLLLVGLIAGGLVFMRRRQQAATLDDDFEDAFDDEEPEIEPDAEPELEEAELVVEEEEDVTPETTDVLGEVEIYIAYGRFPQAITFLQNAIEAEPDRSDIQLKLLEVYVQTEDSIAFNLQLEQLRLLNDEEATAKALELQQKIPGAAEDAAAAMDATVISNEPIEAIAEPEDDEDLSFDLDDLGAETEDDDLELSLELEDEDLDLSLDADDDNDATVVLDDDEIELSLEGADDEIELDLEDELDLGEDDGLDLDEEITLDLDDDSDEEISLDLEDASDETPLESDEEISLDLEDDGLDLDDTVSLDADDDDLLDLSELDDEDGLDLEKDLESVASELSTDDDDALDLDLDDDISLDLDGDDEISLDLDDDDEISLDLDGDDEIFLDLDDDGLDLDLDDDGALDLSDDDDNKLDLARAYIDMGDNDGAKSLLEDVAANGTDEEKQEATELLGKIS